MSMPIPGEEFSQQARICRLLPFNQPNKGKVAMKARGVVKGLGLLLSLLPLAVQAQTYSRTDQIVYHDNLSKWVIGQTASSTNTNTGLVESSAQYDAVTALPLAYYSFGKLQQTLTYNADGTVATVKDGNNNVITLSNWYRGVPRTVQYPATPESPSGATQTAVVNDKGWITAVTDENGFATNYGYDAMGRMASIVYPTGDSTAWNTVTMAFQKINADEHGLPAGHWRASRYQGNKHVNTYYDAMWRPVLEEQLDYANIAGTLSQTVKRYDASGRLAFQSYPTTGVGDFNSITQGTRTTYDALDRVTRVEQDSELGVLTSTIEYETGFMTLTTNPRGLQTLTAFRAYDTPSYDQPLAISELGGDRHTQIFSDIFGKPTQLRRHNGSGSESVSRYYVYDNYQQLCKTIEPETGATVMDYDGAGNLQWSAAGLITLTSTSSCDTIAGRDSGRKVTRYYDARNRLTTLNFPDGIGDQNLVYWPDGLVRQITTFNDGGTSVVNAYDYNKRRLLTGESIGQPGWYAWGIGYGYDANASLSTQTYPTGLIVNYAPNALGQATAVTSTDGWIYASGVSYYPNGALKQFTYGNGVVHTMTQNARQLPARSTDSGGVLDNEYVYDSNANVQYIYDHRNPADHRYLYYDGLDRLTSAGSQMFGGDHWHYFTYDALDNLKSWKLAGVRDYAEYVYDAKNQLTNIKNTAGATIVGLGYDVQGNLANKNGQAYGFDFGNRLRQTTDKEWYRYDGLGRRVLNWRWTEAGVLSQYSQAGQLLYDENYRSADRKATEYVYLAGSLLTTRARNIDTNAWTVSFQHTDALGSPVAKTNTSAQVIDRTNWEPYGAAINKPNYDGIGYTGHVMDGATGLTYMQQRYYDPMIGRFLSVDPVTANSGSGANFNRYWYANNNPYRFIDPDGRYAGPSSICEKVPARCKAIIPVNPSSSGSAPRKGQGMLAHNGRSKTTDATVPSPLPSPQVQSGSSESSAWDDFSRSQCGGNCWDALTHDVLLAMPGEGAVFAGGVVAIGRFGAGRLIRESGGFVTAEGSAVKFSSYYYSKLWATGRSAPFVQAEEVLRTATGITPDARAGFFKYTNGYLEMVYNPATKEVWHLQPIK